MRSLLLIVTLALLAGCDEAGRTGDAGADRSRVEAGHDGLGGDGGRFEFRPPANDRCLGATPAAVGTSKIELQGSTSGATNEYGDSIRCGDTSALVGPQRYYLVDLKQDTTYRFELRPSFDGALFLSGSCGASAINTDCGSQGTTGAFTSKIPAGGSGALFFTAPAAGSYRLAVDSYSASAAGSFTLVLQGFTAPPNSQCTQPQPLAFSAGKVVLEESTLGAPNEFAQQIKCGLPGDLDGPQLYYSIGLTAGTFYRFGLAPQFPAALWVASSAAACKPANLDADCGGITGTVLPPVPAGGKASTVFSPMVTGTYLVAVDGPDPRAAGSYSLEIETYVPAGNMICTAATPLVLTGGAASASGTTLGSLNDRGSLVRCGSSSPLVGPQAYYKVDLKAVTYQVLLKPAFDAVLAVGQSCVSLAADCGSGGLSGAFIGVAPGKTGAVLFKPAAAGPHLIAVDSLATDSAGSFNLEIKEHTPPSYGVCAQPKLLVLAGGAALEAGDTTPLKNDLAGISCGSAGLGPWPGAQAYYRVTLQAGKSYQLELQPEASFDPALYAFPAATSCQAAAVNAACTGHASDTLGAGLKESLLLAPAAAGDWIVVVDSWSVSEVGSFTLSITQK